MSQSRESDVYRAIESGTSYRSSRAFRNNLTVHPRFRRSGIHHRLFFNDTAVTSLLMLSALSGNAFLPDIALFGVPVGIRFDPLDAVLVSSRSRGDNGGFGMRPSPRNTVKIIGILLKQSLIVDLVILPRGPRRQATQTPDAFPRAARVRVLGICAAKDAAPICD